MVLAVAVVIGGVNVLYVARQYRKGRVYVVLQVYFITQLQYIFKLQCMNWFSFTLPCTLCSFERSVDTRECSCEGEKGVRGQGGRSFSCVQERVVS